ncbi:UPF0721 transmembrane protein [Herbiconiux sp. L3-i23]|nr:UPF0721 transmembrane protein [Herbiconiux sp. L3-i23]
MLLVVGAIGGVLSGAFGVGGGIVMVPLLVWLARMDQKAASATSLAAIVPASIVGSIGYLLEGEVDLLAAAALAVGAVPGSLIGTWLLRRINVVVLRWLFIALMIVVAIRMLVGEVQRGDDIDRPWWVLLILVGVGLLVGIASGLFGVGGGVIAVPVLIVGFGAGDLVAKGTSLVMMIASSVVGSASNLRAGTVDLRAGLLVGVAATATSYLGVLLALVMSPQVSAILFAVLLLVSAAQLTQRTVRGHLAARALRRREDPDPA